MVPLEEGIPLRRHDQLSTSDHPPGHVGVSTGVTRRRGHRRNKWLVVGATTGFVFVALCVILQVAPVIRFDSWVSAVAYRAALEHPGWRAVMYAVTWTANTTTITPVAAVAALLLVCSGRWRQACLVVAAMIRTSGVRLLILNSVDRPRPVDRLAPSAGWSFPSGHTTAAATFALVAVLVCLPMLRTRWSRVLLVTLAAGWALAVGVSRVALVVHWPSDVVGAWLMVAALVPSIAALLSALFGPTATRKAADPVAEAAAH
jgi:undecaprenyl-diphosphatase